MQFVPKLQQIELRFEELTRQLADPALIADAAEYRKAAKARSDIAEVVEQVSRMEEGRERTRPGARHAAGAGSGSARKWPRTKPRAWSRNWRASSRRSSSCCCPRIPTTKRTWCSKSAPARAATKPRCSRPRFSACTRATPKRSAGALKSPPPANRRRAA